MPEHRHGQLETRWREGAPLLLHLSISSKSPPLVASIKPRLPTKRCFKSSTVPAKIRRHYPGLFFVGYWQQISFHIIVGRHTCHGGTVILNVRSDSVHQTITSSAHLGNQNKALLSYSGPHPFVALPRAGLIACGALVKVRRSSSPIAPPQALLGVLKLRSCRQ